VKMKDFPQKIEIGKAEVIEEPSGEVVIWALGNMVSAAKKAAEILRQNGVSAGVVNARFAKPLDKELLMKHAKSNKLVATLEDHSARGGFGSAVAEFFVENKIGAQLEIIGWPDEFIPHGSNVNVLRQQYGLDTESVAAKILKALGK